jgi:hypothetical protein
VFSEGSGDSTVMLTITPPVPGRDLPALDEIIRQSEGEIRVSEENGAIQLYLPAAPPNTSSY